MSEPSPAAAPGSQRDSPRFDRNAAIAWAANAVGALIRMLVRCRHPQLFLVLSLKVRKKREHRDGVGASEALDLGHDPCQGVIALQPIENREDDQDEVASLGSCEVTQQQKISLGLSPLCGSRTVAQVGFFHLREIIARDSSLHLVLCEFPKQT